MKRCILLLALISGFQLTMMAQKSKSKPPLPKEDIHVNREFDEKGNLIKFDSVYSYSWSGDTTLLDSIHPMDFFQPFGNQLNFSPDSSFFGNFDQLFFDPFSKKQDSLLKHFDLNGQFRNFQFKGDSLAPGINDLDDFFRQFNESNSDSAHLKPKNQAPLNPKQKSVEDLMKMIQKHMKEIEDQQRRFFDK